MRLAGTQVTKKGNASSVGIEICMNVDLNESAAYRRAALLTAVPAIQEGFNVPTDIFQHYDWPKRNCPLVLRAKVDGWQKFVEPVKSFESKLTSVPVATIGFDKFKGHHFLD